MYIGSYNWLITYVQMERYQDLLEEAAHERLVREVRLAQGRHRATHCRFLTWLGRRLMALGCWLTARYGAPPKGRPHNGRMGAPRAA